MKANKDIPLTGRFCFKCSKAKDKVVNLPHFGGYAKWICSDCLIEDVHAGILIVTTENQLKNAGLAVVPDCEETTTSHVAVEDDGTMSVEGTQINWS